MFTKNKSHFFPLFKSVANDLCEGKNSTINASKAIPHGLAKKFTERGDRFNGNVCQKLVIINSS